MVLCFFYPTSLFLFFLEFSLVFSFQSGLIESVLLNSFCFVGSHELGLCSCICGSLMGMGLGSVRIMNYFFNSYIFCLHFSLIFQPHLFCFVCFEDLCSGSFVSSWNSLCHSFLVRIEHLFHGGFVFLLLIIKIKCITFYRSLRGLRWKEFFLKLFCLVWNFLIDDRSRIDVVRNRITLRWLQRAFFTFITHHIIKNFRLSLHLL